MTFNEYSATLNIEISTYKDDAPYRDSVSFYSNPLITKENAAAWTQYLLNKVGGLVSQEALDSEEFKQIERELQEQARRERLRKEREAIRAEKRRTQEPLVRIPTLSYIPDGLTVDYEKAYRYYILSAINYIPIDKEDFLYQVQSIERMIVKSPDKFLAKGRPDAGYALAIEICRALPKFKENKGIEPYLDYYKSRIRKFIKLAYHVPVTMAIAWNNKEKLDEANALIEEHKSIYESWGLKSKFILEQQAFVFIGGNPIKVERTLSKEEREAIRAEEYRKKELERKEKAEEAERRSLIPLNPYLENEVFTPDNAYLGAPEIGWEINSQGRVIKKMLNDGKARDAMLLFLQIVKSMCRHFVSDEHYCYFDDMYHPDMSCEIIVKDLNEAYKKGKFAKEDIEFFHEAWKEIEDTEAYKGYGIGYYKFAF